MKRKLFYFTLRFFILFFENKPFSFKNFLLPLQAFNQFEKLYSIKNNINSENSNNFIKEYYQKRNQNIKKIIISSGLLFLVKNTFSNSEKKTLKDILMANPKIILFCFPCHVFEGFFSYIFKQATGHYPFYRNSSGTSKILHSFDILQEDDKQEDNKHHQHIKNISTSAIRNPHSKKSSSQIRSDNQPSNTEVLKWQKEFLTKYHKKKELTKHLEELESKSNQILEINSLMEARNNEIINLKNNHKTREKNEQEKFNFLKNEYEKKINTAENIQIEQWNKIQQLNLLVTRQENETIGLKKELESKSNQIVKINSLMEANNNEITKLKEEAKILEHNKNEKEKLILTLKNKLMTMEQGLAELKTQEELNQEEKDNLVREIEKKEKNLLIFALKIREQKKSMYERNEQYKKLKNCWKEAEEKEKEARAAVSLPKMDLISVNEHQLSSLHRLEGLKKQLLPLASL
jgi:chromosome segregation ATPase